MPGTAVRKTHRAPARLGSATGSTHPKVLFIGGAGRSGSTLLDCVLGQFDGVFSAGELASIWSRGALGNQLCGCGNPFLDCSFWREVVNTAFGQERESFEELERLRRAAQRIRHLPYHLLGRVPDPVSEYGNRLVQLYHAIARVADARIIVDSSKEPAHGFLLSSLQDVDLHVLHLIRDSRAVAFSWQRKRKRPEVHWKVKYMPRMGAARSALMWNYYNLFTGLLRRKSSDYQVIRYESFVADPRSTIQSVLDRLGESFDASLVFSSECEISLNENHSVAGNPARFHRGLVQIKSDDQWKEQLSRRHRWMTTSITFPWLIKYCRRGAKV